MSRAGGDNMNLRLWWKRILTLAGLLLLGAVGSGIWDLFLRSASLNIGAGLVGISTLGITSLRDGLYTDIASGNFDRASILILLLITGLGSGFVVGVVTSDMTLGPAKRVLDKAGLKPIAIIIAVTIGFTLMMTARTVYVMMAIASVDQLKVIIAPLVTENDRLILASRLARSTTRAEYVGVVKEMQAIAKTNKIELQRMIFL
jgi:hypothetical protein